MKFLLKINSDIFLIYLLYEYLIEYLYILIE